MTDQPSDTRRIVVALDGSEAARGALRWSIPEARLMGAAIEAVHVWRHMRTPNLPGLPTVSGDDLRSAAEALLRRELSVVGADAVGGVPITTTAVEGPPALRLTGAAADAYLLVVGARGSGVSAASGLGSVSQQCTHLSTVPVAVVRDDLTTRGHRNRIAVGVDGSEESLRALGWAASLARRHQVPLHVVMAWSTRHHPQPEGEGRRGSGGFDQGAADQVLDTLIGNQSDQLGDVEVSRAAVAEHPTRAMIDAGAAADLVVVGARGLGGFKRLALGSVSNQVVHQAPCPVVVVPHRYEGETIA